MGGGRGAGLTDARVQAEVGGQLAPIREAADVADGGHERRGDDHVDTGDGHQPLDWASPARRRRSAGRPRRSPCRGSRPGAGQRRRSRARRSPAVCSASQARPLTPNRSDAGGRSLRQRINTAWYLVLGPGARRTSCARRASRRRITRTRSSGAQRLSSPAQSSLAKVRASRRSVLARAWRMPASFGETTITRATCASKDPRDRPTRRRSPPTPPSHARPGSARTAPTSRAASRSTAERSRPSGTIATSQKSRWTSSATALTRSSSPSIDVAENRRANDIDGSCARSRNQASRKGRDRESPGSKPIAQNGLPNLRSPKKAPVPVSPT